MRIAIVTLLAACGRVGFDGLEPDGGPTGHDEDQDGVADTEDVCPHRADDQRDQDADGVGDACDPEPANPRQSLRFFDGFDTDRPEWRIAPPVAGDALPLSDVSTAELEMPTRNLLVEVSGEVTAVYAGRRNQFFVAARSPDEQEYVEIIDLDAGRRRTLMHFGDPDYTPYAEEFEAEPVVTGPVTMQLELYDDRVAARTEYAGLPVVQAGPSLSTQPGTTLFVYVDGVDLRWRYFVVIATE